MRVAIIGAGGHAKVVVDAALAAGLAIEGLVDESGEAVGTSILGQPVVASAEELEADAFVVAIGDNLRRAACFAHYSARGLSPVSVVHPSAVLGSEVAVGSGVVVLAGTVINAGSRICDNVIINTSSSVDHDCTIGCHAHVAPGCRLAGSVRVGEGAFLGVGTNVVPGRRIGAWSVCGAGSTVIEDVAERVTVAGTPARELAR